MTVRTDNTEPMYLTPREAADILRISHRTLSRWEAVGRIQAARLPNGYRRYLRDDITRLLATS